MDYTDVAALQAYVRTFSSDITAKALIEFTSANFFTHIPGNKGKIVLTDMRKNGSLARGFTPTFTGYDSQTLKPITVEVNDFKSEFNLIPSELRYTYLGFLQQRGFNPRDFPFEQYFLEQHAAGIAAEMEVAIWEGLRTGTGADPIISMIDGFGKRVTDAITAGNTPVVTGTITVDNIVDALRAMYNQIDKALKGQKVYCYLSVNHRQDFFIKRGETLQNIMDEWTAARFNTGNMELVFCPGIEDNKIMITTMDNLLYTYDDMGDADKWFFDRKHYSIEGSCTWAAGTQIMRGDNGFLIVNDQW